MHFDQVNIASDLMTQQKITKHKQDEFHKNMPVCSIIALRSLSFGTHLM